MTSIRVVNKRTDPFDVYIGRGSIWGNPFPLAGGHTHADRMRVIRQYEEYLLSRPDLMARLPELRGKRLGCYCAPEPCHGDVLKKHAEAERPGSSGFSHALLVTGSRTWSDEACMRRAFNEVWLAWGPSGIAEPALLSGRCPHGADAMAERLWRSAGFEILAFPADWRAHGKAAGFRRNQELVDAALDLQAHGVQVRCMAFLDLCRRPGCERSAQEQYLSAGHAGHYSHGTMHCRGRALSAGLGVVDVISIGVPPL